MKKLLLILLCLSLFKTKATVWNVGVSSNQFSPSTLNVVVGDVIHFFWVDGFHTTTSLTIPPSAVPWNENMISVGNTFDYTVAVAGSYSYYCQVHGFSMSGSFVATGATPVTLSSFEIETVNDRPVLKWTTQTEVNADHFSIRKSLDGTNFTSIADVPAGGNSTSSRSYSFTDGKPSSTAKYLYYALGTIDKDGRLQLSPIKLYRNQLGAVKLITSLSPNPVSSMGHLMLKFNADKPGKMLAKLIDIQGKMILKAELSAEKGINNGHIHLGDVPAGTYTIYFSLDGVSESYKITKK